MSLSLQLEIIEGELWANVWMTECIARIDLQTGSVTHWMLLHGLKKGLRRSHPRVATDVLNGDFKFSLLPDLKCILTLFRVLASMGSSFSNELTSATHLYFF